MGAARAGLRLVLFGAPGVGKGTQAAEIRRRIGIPHVSTGEMLRGAMSAGTPLGRRVREIVESGGLVPDDLVGALVEERLEQEDARQGFLLDGYPRTLGQARFLDEILDRRGRPLDRVVNIVLPEGEIVERLAGRRVCGSCGATYHARFSPPRVDGRCDVCGGTLGPRADDAPETVAGRLRVYQEQTAPVLEHYKGKGLLVTVDGSGSPHEVLARIVASVPGLEA